MLPLQHARKCYRFASSPLLDHDFTGLNNILILSDLGNEFVHRNIDPINLDDNEEERMHTLLSYNKQQIKK